jgi:hypothetical protein
MISCDLQAVVVSGDPSVLGMLPAWLRNMGVRPTVFSNPAAAVQAMRGQRVDAVFVDSALDPNFSVLREVRATPAGRNLICMAIVSRFTSIREAFRYSDFILEKPFLQQRVTQTLRAAHGMMLRDRMQYSRMPLHTEASVFNSLAKSFSAVATNVSQTGIALESSAQFHPGDVVQIQFRLPDAPKSLACKARVIWSDQHGRAGFSFLEMKSSDKELLSTWIENEFVEAWQQRTVLPVPAAIAATAGSVAAYQRA